MQTLSKSQCSRISGAKVIRVNSDVSILADNISDQCYPLIQKYVSDIVTDVKTDSTFNFELFDQHLKQNVAKLVQAGCAEECNIFMLRWSSHLFN